METSFLKRVTLAVFLSIVVSLFLFPVGFRGLPESINSKQILAMLGAGLFFLDCVRDKEIRLSRTVITSLVLASLFSIWNFFSTVINNTSDYSYATYIVSYLVWIFSAYAVTKCISKYAEANLDIITNYLVYVCIAQGIIAILVDNIPIVQHFVDTWFIQDQTPKRVERLYGIGASLDNAGVRFTCVLLLLSHQIKNVSEDSKVKYAPLLFEFFLICVLGNMISRTTTVGLVLGIAYIIFSSILSSQTKVITASSIKRVLSAGIIITIVVIASIHLYNTSDFAHNQLRFAFEGFFNFIEKGEFSTGSTDKLMHMWVWPSDTAGWLCGYGLFDGWAYNTDIGYCRFTLYCGLVGMTLFSLFFIYCGLALHTNYGFHLLLCICLVSVSFIIWVKVSTDIFQLYALLICVSELEKRNSPSSLQEAEL